ncbi:hypothetical protein [Fimbriiglobus ruber]|uniref:DUF1318 domain-containing protein n=1 Tax=Fimbriiglobus ruber TaxID=1908690 RepID=A0A225D8U2_9BACT|nr:hypothetical protein [Fimbriiglobus ruber]OWK36064.1 hypothetical protein FRUB_08627 [Fimbriiglobus ruber]
MRKILALAVLLGAATITVGQQPDGPPPIRYAVGTNVETFPQTSARETLASVVRAIERNKADYLAAYLLDPVFVDARVADRAKLIEPAVDRDLRAVRNAQRQKDVEVRPEEKLPLEPKLFDIAVREEANRRAFKLVTKDVREYLIENPDTLKDLKRFLRDGVFTDAGESASVALKDVKDRQVFLKKIGTRWFIEDRQKDVKN